MKKSIFTSVLLSLFLMGFVFIGCENVTNSSDERQIDTNYDPSIVPENFVSVIDNNYLPLPVGQVMNYQVTENGEVTEIIVVEVLTETKDILGVTCTVVRDTVTLPGSDQMIEDTRDWYAQDEDGTVWYMGEDVDNYDESGNLEDHDGSFEAGVDGAKPGIVMMGVPITGLPYRQEYYFNEAEDWGKVIETGVTVTTPAGTFTDCIVTEDWNAMEPGVLETKYYAPGIGFVRETKDDGSEIVELMSYTLP